MCLYFKKSDMKGTTLNLPLFWKVCNSNCNLFGNIALKTKIGHVPTYMYEFSVELLYEYGVLFAMKK